MRAIRNLARSMERTPFERLPVTSSPQAAGWGGQARRVGGQAAIYFPGLALLLGWPYLAYQGLDGRVGRL